MRIRALCVSAAVISIVMGSGAAAAVPESETAKAPVVKSEAPSTKKTPSFAEMMQFIDKIFPPQPDPDPARLALARTSAQSIWPQGQYGKMMESFMGGIFDRVMTLKESDLGSMAPAKAKSAKADPAKANESLHQKLTAEDPYFDQRVAAIRAVLNEEVGKVSAVVDPRLRDGIARAMARKFDAKQLNDINTFFATPSGNALASHYMELWFDPDTIRSLFSTMPDMMKLMPGMMEKLKAANDKFPAPPKKDKDKPAKK